MRKTERPCRALQPPTPPRQRRRRRKCQSLRGRRPPQGLWAVENVVTTTAYRSSFSRTMRNREPGDAARTHPRTPSGYYPSRVPGTPDGRLADARRTAGRHSFAVLVASGATVPAEMRVSKVVVVFQAVVLASDGMQSPARRPPGKGKEIWVPVCASWRGSTRR